MSTQLVLDIMQEAFKIGLMLSLPIMLAALVVGVIVSVIQAITSVQEQTMVFVPKIIAVGLAALICFSWMMGKVIAFTIQLFTNIPDFLQ